MKKKHFIFFTAVFLTGALLTAQEQTSQTQLLPDTTTLLLSYVENDAELKNLTISAKKAQLSYKSTMIDTGFDVTLSSGTVTLQLNDDGSKLSAKRLSSSSVRFAGPFR